jgi:hypothetical protein
MAIETPRTGLPREARTTAMTITPMNNIHIRVVKALTTTETFILQNLLYLEAAEKKGELTKIFTRQ